LCRLVDRQQDIRYFPDHGGVKAPDFP